MFQRASTIKIIVSVLLICLKCHLFTPWYSWQRCSLAFKKTLAYIQMSLNLRILLILKSPLGWNHRYKYSTVVITMWLTVMKYPYFKWQRIFYFLRRRFFPLSLPLILPDLTEYMSNTVGVLEEAGPDFIPSFWWGSCCSYF